MPEEKKLKKYIVYGKCVWYIDATSEEEAMKIAEVTEPDGGDPEGAELDPFEEDEEDEEDEHDAE